MNNANVNRWYICLGVILTGIIIFPYILGFAIETEDLQFSGSFIGVDDQNSYLAKMRYGYEGNLLYRSPYTNFPQEGIVAFLPYIILGKLAGGQNLVGQFQFFMILFRVAAVVLYVNALRKFFELFIPDSTFRKGGVILVLFGGGFGFLYFTGLTGLWNGRLPLEFYSPEAFSFLALLTLPHIIIARSLMLLTIVVWFSKQGLTIGRYHINYKYIAVFYSYLIYLFQPITLPSLFGIFGLYFLLQGIEDLFFRKISGREVFRAEYFGSTMMYFILMMPAIIYNLYLLLFDPYVKAWGAQNILVSAPVQDYLYAYIIYMILIIMYFIKEKKQSVEYKTLGLWIVISLIGVYLPLSIQRRFIEGSWVFIILFAILGIEKLYEKKTNTSEMRIAISILCLSSFFILSGSVFQILAKPDRVFIDQSETDLYQFIDANVSEGEFVFADHRVGNEIPVWTDNRTITGVGPESINESAYLSMYDNYISGQISNTEFERLLSDMDIEYYVIGEIEQANCNLIFSNDAYSLCRVGEYE